MPVCFIETTDETNHGNEGPWIVLLQTLVLNYGHDAITMWPLKPPWMRLSVFILWKISLVQMLSDCRKTTLLAFRFQEPKEKKTISG